VDEPGQQPSPAAGYRAGLEAGELRFQRCGGCALAVFHPRVVCPGCGSTDLSWEASSGLGAVYSTTAVPVRDGEPYNVALVDLDEGFRVMSCVDGVPARDVTIGSRVRLAVVDGDEGPVAAFRLDGPAADGAGGGSEAVGGGGDAR
jgi:uncharacterized protein